MADTLDTIGNFSIQDTMEMGMGSQELLNNLFEPETISADPDDLQSIVKEVDDVKPSKPKATKSVGEVISKNNNSDDEDEDNKSPNTKNILNSFLSDEEEEEAAEADTIVKKPSSEEDSDTQVEPSRFKALTNDLYKLGVFTNNEGEEEAPEVNTPEEFLEKFQAEKKKGAIEVVNNFIGQFGEDYQQAFDAIFVKGVDPKEYFNTYNSIANFSDMDLTQESNQELIMKRALLDQGFEDDDVLTEIERLKNYGDLESVSAKHHKVLIKKEAVKLQELEVKSEKELQQKASIKNQYINNVQSILQEKLKTKEFDGIPLNPKLAGELQDFLLVDKYKTNSGETLTDFDKTILELKRPENHATKVKLGLLLKILEKDPTLSTIQKTGVTKQSNQLFSEVVRQVEKSNRIGKPQESPSKSWFL